MVILVTGIFWEWNLIREVVIYYNTAIDYDSISYVELQYYNRKIGGLHILRHYVTICKVTILQYLELP